jgi:long-chain fatty acid transport protein
MVSKPVPFFMILIIMICYSGYSAGFLINKQDAAAAAMGNCFTSIANNSSAVFYNPAGINQLEGTQLRAGFHLHFSNTSFRGSETRKRTDMDDDLSYLLMGYLTHKVSDKISIGGGIFTPFALITEWPNRWEGRTVSTYAYLRTFCVNPVVSIKVHPRLFLAVGIDYLYSDFKLRRVIDPNQMIGLPLGISPGKITLEGFDDTWGYNLGLLFHLNDQWKIGVAYRSKLNLEFDGHAHYQLPPVLHAFYPPKDISFRLELPPTVSAELSTQMWDKWTFAAGILWTGWSVIDELIPKFRDNLFIPPSMRSVLKEWRDVIDFHCGVQYQLNPAWVFRGGYIFDRSPVPERTLGPMVPDSDGHIVSLGIGYTRGNFLIDVACMASLLEDRHTRRNLDGLDGKYTSTGISLLISSTYYF